MLYRIVGYKKLSKSYVLYLRCLQKSKGVCGTLVHVIIVPDKLCTPYLPLINNEVFITLSKNDDGIYKEHYKFIERSEN